MSLITATQAFSSLPGGELERRHHGPGGPAPVMRPPTPVEAPHIGHHRGITRQVIPLTINEEFSGQGVIMLKNELLRQAPGINLNELKLLEVNLVAKSKFGRGEATLAVGMSESYPQTVGGDPRDFNVGHPYTFRTMTLSNPSYDSDGKWQIHLRGNIRVQEVALIVEREMATTRLEVVNISMYEQESNGVKILPLKRLISMQNPSLDLSDAELESVILTAKSRMGAGEASLIVGQNVSYPVNIPGRPRAFDSMAPRSYRPITLNNSLGSSYGNEKWQIELRGNIKVQNILVKIKVKSPRYGRDPRNNGRYGGRI